MTWSPSARSSGKSAMAFPASLPAARGLQLLEGVGVSRRLGRGQGVQGASRYLFFQVSQVRGGCQRLAGRLLEQLLHRQPGTHAVHVVAQPVPSRRRIGRRQFPHRVRGPRGPQRLVQLSGDHRPQHVRREVSESGQLPSGCPAGSHRRRSWGGYSSRCSSVLIPSLGQVGHGQGSFKDFLLKLVAQHDVHRIGELVRVHADQCCARTRVRTTVQD